MRAFSQPHFLHGATKVHDRGIALAIGFDVQLGKARLLLRGLCGDSQDEQRSLSTLHFARGPCISVL